MSAETRYILGFVAIGICCAYVVYNTIIIVVYSLHLLWVYLRRLYVQCRRKQLRREVISTVDRLNRDQQQATQQKFCATDDNAEDIEKQWFEPDDCCPSGVFTGGYKAELIIKQKYSTRKIKLDQPKEPPSQLDFLKLVEDDEAHDKD